MPGELKIVELRERAKYSLGERFARRRFHNVLLDHGAVPLPVFEAVVYDWIRREGAAR